MPKPTRCLILACGNTLRSDDGVGPWLSQWAETRFRDDPTVQVIARQQWTPDLAEDIAHACSVLFIDSSITSEPGVVQMAEVQPAATTEGLATHHLGAPELLAMGRELYNSLPRKALLLTIGAASTELGETLSDTVAAALPEACNLLEEMVIHFLTLPEPFNPSA
ncbi:MAG: hydrogenase maturation protease [Terracidiphilus sp.]|jgi:hydrogenase maturation protease